MHLGDLLREDGVRRVEDLVEAAASSLVSERMRIGESAGFTLRYVRLERQVGRQLASGRGDGGLHVARGGVDVSIRGRTAGVIDVEPSVLVDVISVRPAMRPKRRSSGVATDEAIVSGLAPGQARAHLDGGKVDARQRRDGKLRVREDPREEHAPPRAATWRPAAG